MRSQIPRRWPPRPAARAEWADSPPRLVRLSEAVHDEWVRLFVKGGAAPYSRVLTPNWWRPPNRLHPT